MLISWITQFSLIEFPKEISCIVFTPGCNMRCDFCHNPEYVLPEKIKKLKNSFILQKAFFNFLNSRIWLLTGVSICWWEPTMQKDLVEFCQKIKNMWFKVKLDTNGTNPELLQELLSKNLLDYVAMDLKTTIIDYEKVVWTNIDTNKILESVNTIKNSNINYEFRTTLIKNIHTLEHIKEISGTILKGVKNYNLQNFKKTKILNPNFSWESFSLLELNFFKEVVLKSVENCEIRN